MLLVSVMIGSDRFQTFSGVDHGNSRMTAGRRILASARSRRGRQLRRSRQDLLRARPTSSLSSIVQLRPPLAAMSCVTLDGAAADQSRRIRAAHENAGFCAGQIGAASVAGQSDRARRLEETRHAERVVSAAPIFPSRRWCSAATCSAGRRTRRPRSRCSTGFAAAGLNAIDTADVYSAWAPGNKGGESETIIGEWMKARGKRNAITVITKVGSPMGPGKKGLSRALYRGGGRSVAEAAADRDHRPLSLALARRGDALRGDARRLPAADRQGQDPLVRRLELQRRPARRRARRGEGQGPAALRGPAARIQSLRSRRVRRAAARSLPGRGDRRHHLLQPRQGLPLRQIPRRGRPRPKPARRRREGLSERARLSHSRRARRGRGAPRRQAGRGRARLDHRAARRHRADRQRDLARAAGKPHRARRR